MLDKWVIKVGIHSTKIFGNFGLKLNGSVRSNRKSFEKSGPPRPFEVDHFSRLDRSDRNGPFHLTILTHSQSQVLAVRYLSCTKWRKMLISALLWIVNSRSIGVIRISMYSYHRSVAASQAKGLFSVLRQCWRLLRTRTIHFPTEFGMFFSSFDSNLVFQDIWQISGNCRLKIIHYTG